jgi:hypothetical protein
MSKIRMPISAAVCITAMLAAGVSLADEKKDTKAPLTVTVPQPQVTTPQPLQQQQPMTTAPVAQPPPPQVILIQPPPAAPPPPQVQQPVGKTRTTAAPYEPEAALYADKTESHRPNSALLGPGVGTFLLGYGPSAVVGAISPRSSDKSLFIPVAGPWMDLANRDCKAKSCGENETISKALIITSGAAQGLGALLTIGSLIIPETTTVRERTAAELKPSVKVFPVSFGGAGAGLGAIGTF